MSKHHTRKNKKHIKRKINRRKTKNYRKTNNKKRANYRKNTNYRKRSNKTNKKRYNTKKMKGGNAKNTLTPSPIMNGWYNMMDTPSSLFLTYDGVEVPSNMNSDPLQGHNL
tara:strand:- start:789 stop:1121 length:333 start_codon:yes stop_codon:yes gene_type:complete